MAEGEDEEKEPSSEQNEGGQAEIVADMETAGEQADQVVA